MSNYTIDEISRQPTFWREALTIADTHAEPLRGFVADFQGAVG